MKLAIKYLSDIEGIGITQSISFVFFFAMFILILFYVLRTKTSYYTGISAMPLEDETDQFSNIDKSKNN